MATVCLGIVDGYRPWLGLYRESGIWENFGSGAWGSEYCWQGCERVALAGLSSAAGLCGTWRMIEAGVPGSDDLELCGKMGPSRDWVNVVADFGGYWGENSVVHYFASSLLETT